MFPPTKYMIYSMLLKNTGSKEEGRLLFLVVNNMDQVQVEIGLPKDPTYKESKQSLLKALKESIEAI